MMKYISTRGNSEAVTFAEAVTFGMVPAHGGGLFVPREIPILNFDKFVKQSYRDVAINTLFPYMDGFDKSEIEDCVNSAYSLDNFDDANIVPLVSINNNVMIEELWHGPTAAFKDVALQIMPHFMRYSKIKCGDKSHTMILVATSGDTGKAALEGFKNCDGISIVVFYPHGGVSEVQKLQMVTTDGNNTKVIAVHGNFDDCQNGVKALFADTELAKFALEKNIKFSSANSINWGRLCPQIVYYVKAYLDLVAAKKITYGDEIDFCVPTGNFGNILAGYYAKRMGLPIRKLICASNKNNVLTDFFKTGTYNRNREFHRTMSPSMDILISSNLERFIFEMADRDAEVIKNLYGENGLAGKGVFTVSQQILDKMNEFIEAYWTDEQTALDTIGAVYKDNNYILDTHTAVAVSAVRKNVRDVPVVVTSTASPYKFSLDVLKGLGENISDDEFECVNKLQTLGAGKIHRAVAGLKEKKVLHDKVININDMKETVRELLS